MNLMQNEGTIKEIFFKSDDNNDQIYKNNDKNNIDNYNNSPCELQRKNDIECYNKIMGSNPNYLTIFYSFIINHTQKLKIFVSTKAKKLRNINYKIMMLYILL
jgi:hypothetical protein